MTTQCMSQMQTIHKAKAYSTGHTRCALCLTKIPQGEPFIVRSDVSETGTIDTNLCVKCSSKPVQHRDVPNWAIAVLAVVYVMFCATIVLVVEGM